MTPTTHTKPNRTKPCPTCQKPMEYVPGEMYGEDADGNRGEWVGPHFVCCNEECACCAESHNADEFVDEGE